jgi:CobQ-like glutamine amidotransferase family enzyme
MRIEILYPELCCLYGDKGNTLFLKKCLPEAEFIETQLNEKPAFLQGDVDLCCMYSMSEQSQERILDRLMQWKQEIKDCLAAEKTMFLLLGNALELFGQYILREDGSRVEGLQVYDTYTKRHAPNRFNTLIQAPFEGMTLLGYTSRFAHTFGITEDIALAKTDIGCGSCEGSTWEGICDGNVIATYLLGPVLVLNPDFARRVLERLGVPCSALPFEDDLRKAYLRQLEEFRRSDLDLN